jgi:hypothetical protein
MLTASIIRALTLVMEAVRTCGMLLSFYQGTQHNDP